MRPLQASFFPAPVHRVRSFTGFTGYRCTVLVAAKSLMAAPARHYVRNPAASSCFLVWARDVFLPLRHCKEASHTIAHDIFCYVQTSQAELLVFRMIGPVMMVKISCHMIGCKHREVANGHAVHIPACFSKARGCLVLRKFCHCILMLHICNGPLAPPCTLCWLVILLSPVHRAMPSGGGVI